MRASSAPLRRGCDGCFAAAVAIVGALAAGRCALEVRRHHAVPLIAPADAAPGGPRALDDAAPRAARGSPGAPAERAPRLPRQRFLLSRPADDRRGLPAVRRHRGAFLVRDPPHRASGSPHRELMRRSIGL